MLAQISTRSAPNKHHHSLLRTALLLTTLLLAILQLFTAYRIRAIHHHDEGRHVEAIADATELITMTSPLIKSGIPNAARVTEDNICGLRIRGLSTFKSGDTPGAIKDLRAACARERSLGKELSDTVIQRPSRICSKF